MTTPQQLIPKLWNCRAIWRDAFRSLACLSAILLLTAVTGCGLTVQQKTAVQQFGSAASDFAALTRSEFIQSRQDVNSVQTAINTLAGALELVAKIAVV